MPKRTQSVPKYRLHKRSGQAVVSLGGKDRYLGPHGSLESLAPSSFRSPNQAGGLLGRYLRK